MRTTLCIIDMQPLFAAHASVLDKVIRQVRLAKKRKSAIVVVEFSGFGSTHPDIMDAIAKSGCKFTVVQKYENCGSGEIISACNKHGYSKRAFRMCGVNRCACVRDTVEGLAQCAKKSKIEVVWSATEDGWVAAFVAKRIYSDIIKDYPNVKIGK